MAGRALTAPKSRSQASQVECGDSGARSGRSDLRVSLGQKLPFDMSAQAAAIHLIMSFRENRSSPFRVDSTHAGKHSVVERWGRAGNQSLIKYPACL